MPPAWGVSRSSWTRPCTRQWPRLRRSSWRFPTSHGSPKYHHPWIFHCEPSSYWGSPIYGSLEIPSFFRTIPWGTNRKMWKDPWGNPFGKRSTFYGGFSTVSLVYGRLPFFRSRRSILGMDQIILAYLYAVNIQHQLFCWGTEWYGRWFWVNKFSQIWQTGCSKMGPEKGGYRKLGTERERYICISQNILAPILLLPPLSLMSTSDAPKLDPFFSDCSIHPTPRLWKQGTLEATNLKSEISNQA